MVRIEIPSHSIRITAFYRNTDHGLKETWMHHSWASGLAPPAPAMIYGIIFYMGILAKIEQFFPVVRCADTISTSTSNYQNLFNISMASCIREVRSTTHNYRYFTHIIENFLFAYHYVFFKLCSAIFWPPLMSCLQWLHDPFFERPVCFFSIL